MGTMLTILVALISIILIFNVGYILQKFGGYPFIRNPKKPKEAFYSLSSKHLMEKKISRDYHVLHGWNYDIRKFGRKEIYTVKDSYKALEKVIENYQKDPKNSHYDDLVHLSNFISNHIRYDDKINALIEKIAEMTIKQSSKK